MPGLFQIDKNLKSLERCQSLEEIQRLYEAGDYKAVVHLLRPTLCTSGFDRAKHLEFMTSIPERPAQLLLLQVCAASVPHTHLHLLSLLVCVYSLEAVW